MKILAVYPGRFQPFHKGHAQVFQWLKNKFGDAVIGTSDKVEAPKSPFNFKEKKQMMKLAGVPASKIKQVTNPYIAREILEGYDPKTTVLVFAVSQKDMEEDPRFSFKPLKSGKPSYLQPYKGNEKKLKPFGDVQSPKGYVIVTPTFTFDVLGQPATSASELRKQFVSLDNKKQKEFIKDLFGKYDESVHKLMKTKLKAMMNEKKSVKKLKEHFTIGLTFARNEMPQVGASRTFVQYMKSNGIDCMRRKIDPSELKSSQMEFDRGKIEGLKEKLSSNPIVVSNDGHVLDGHHRWLADSETGRKCDAYVVDLPILDLLHRAKHYTAMELNEEITRKELAPMLDSFVSFASDKLGLKSMPTVRYKTDDEYNSFAAYNPSSNELSIHTMNRHPMDIFRSVAHELVHHKQNEDGRIGKDIAKEGETGSDIENEANAEAGKIMRWFAKANPDMFGKSFVVETNTAAMAPVGGVRGLGNVTGEVSPTVTSNYVISNQTYTEKMKSNHTSGLWTNLDDDGSWLDAKGKSEYQKKAVKGFKAIRSQLNEGINDPGKLKAVFLAGGPGSGKDFVMNKALAGNGLREINSDTAFEYLMSKHGLDFEMPEEERVEREIVRGRAKNITSKKEINSLAGRLGLIVNGTADDMEKIKTVKAELEDLGYDTMMVFVNTSDEVSRQRNVERGKSGGRKVPDGTDKQGNPNDTANIRKEKWDLAQENISKLENLFGKDSFTVIDNTADIRKVSPEQKEKIEAEFSRVRRMTMQFVQSPVQNKRGQAWTQRRARYQGTTQYAPPKAYTRMPTPTRTEMPKAITKPSSALMDQARRLGLSYYGFGRFGRKVGGKNKVMYHSRGDQLVRVQITEDLRQWFSKTHPKGKWKRLGPKGEIRGDCAREPGEGKPKCLPAAKAYSMSREERKKAFDRKRRKDPVADRPGKGNKPINVETESVQKAIDKINADRMSEEILMEKNKPTNPSLWSKAKSLAKSKFDVYPSAYANGWAAKWYKSKGGGWKSVNEERGSCWSGYTQKGMKKKGNRMVPNCVPVNEAFEQFAEANGNKPINRQVATDSLDDLYRGMTPGQKKKKKLHQEAMGKPEPWGYNFGDNGLGPTAPVPRAGTPYGFGYGSAYSMGLSESIEAWMNSERTQQKFIEKYGKLWEEKLVEAAHRLEEAGCGCDHSEKKSLKKLREGMEGNANNMSTVPTQRKDEQQLNERGADSKGLYRPTEKGAGLTAKGARHFGVQTAVTERRPTGKRAARRRSFCARMGGMPGPMKDEKGRPTRKAMSLRRWRCRRRR